MTVAGATVPPGADPSPERMWRSHTAGDAVPQGSKTVARSKTGASFVRDANAGKLKPWRSRMTETFARDWRGHAAIPPRTPVTASLVFVFPRPSGHFGRRGLLPSAPAWTDGRAVGDDLDKLTRAVLDSLKAAAVLTDDSQIAKFAEPFGKFYADDAAPWGHAVGVHVELRWRER